MIDATPLFRLYAQRRAAALRHEDPAASQLRTLRRLVARAATTRFGHDHGLARIGDPTAFRARVPLRRYEDFWQEYWQKPFPRLVDCCWPGLVPFFAETSGTSAGVTKFIPLSRAMLRSHRHAGLDLLVHHLANRPGSRLFGGRHLLLGGSAALTRRAPGVRSGDLSGIAAATAPLWTRPFVFPPAAVARLGDWSTRIARLVDTAPRAPIRSISGTPSWLLLFFDELVAHDPDRRPLLRDFFPDLELVVHGGVAFAPYRKRFAEWLADGRAELREAYAASEGFIAAADRNPGEGLRLIFGHGIFYEFVPVAELTAPQPRRHWIGEIETGVDYAIAVTTCAGLFAYIVGDTVRFVSAHPPRLLVTGRLSYTLSAFGEHLTGEEVEAAIAAAARDIAAGVRDFAIGALFPERRGERGGHLVIVEFEEPVAEPEQRRFAAAVDRVLAERNLDYRAHRSGLAPLALCVLPHGAFARWMRRRGRLGGQNKVPRIVNDPELWRDLRDFAAASEPRAAQPHPQ
jgi:hypothetical protein